jgi:hypothetical protein
LRQKYKRRKQSRKMHPEKKNRKELKSLTTGEKNGSG